MTRTVRIQGEAAQFPQLCANCLAPATQHIPLSGERARGRHRERREFEVPFCDACHDLYQGNTPFHRAVEAATKRMPIAMISMIVSGVLILVFGATGFAMSLNALARDRLAWPWVVSGAFAVLLVASGVIWYTSRRTVEATLPSEEAARRIADWMEAQSIGRQTTHYRMRDWLISRQRYWGAPIPIVYCERCGTVPVPERDLPVLLPHTESWQPGDSGRSPLANLAGFVHCRCPLCDGPAERETDTMTGFACSSWYFLRFVSPHYSDGPFDPRALERWGRPDMYVGGAEHATMHLLYARFWTKGMADAGIVPFREPFPVLRSQGVMHALDPETGTTRRMSKSTGNVVTPDRVASTYGADALRLYLLFMAPFENDTVWEEGGIAGSKRFLQRTWDLVNAVAKTSPAGGRSGDDVLRRTMHHTVQAMTGDLEAFKFNTAVAAAMSCLNVMARHHRRHSVTVGLREAARTFVLLLAPLAPYLAEELWARLGGSYSVHQQRWPSWDEALVSEETFTLVVQVDGRVRDRLAVPVGVDEETVRHLVLESAGVRPHLEGRLVTRVVYVPGRLVNVVTA